MCGGVGPILYMAGKCASFPPVFGETLRCFGRSGGDPPNLGVYDDLRLPVRQLNRVGHAQKFRVRTLTSISTTELVNESHGSSSFTKCS